MRVALSLVMALTLLTGLAVGVAWAAPPVQGNIVHIVRSGETLSSIARRYGTTVQAILQVNSLANPNRIYVGQTLIIPLGPTHPLPSPTPLRSEAVSPSSASNYYVVCQGDSLSAIARRFGTTVSAIVQANNLNRYLYIYPGQRLVIPLRDRAGPMPTPVPILMPTPIPAPSPCYPPPWPVNWPDFPWPN